MYKSFAGSDTLELEIARTSDVFTAGNIIKPVLSGTLLRLSSSSSKQRGTWIPRHFVLKQDHCLYFYKTETVSFSTLTVCCYNGLFIYKMFV